MANWNEKRKTLWMYIKKVSRHIRQQGLSTTFSKVQRRLQTKVKMIKSVHDSDQRVKNIFQELLQAYQNGQIKGLAIISSGMEFDELYNQRTINFAKYLTDRGYGVVYVTWQYDEAEQHDKAFQSVYSNLYQIPMYPYLYSLAELKIFQPITDKIFISTFPAKAFYTTLPALKEQNFKIIYDIMDEWEEFFKTGDASWYQRSIEEAFIKEADLVSAVSVPLIQKFSRIRADIVLSGNGYDKRISKHPGVAKKQKDSHIHIGYFGHLTSSWFDWNLIFHLAERLDFIIHLIGHGAPEEYLKRAELFPNIYFYGKIHPGQLHEYAQQWHIGIIPFKKSKLSEAVDPIKVYEYLYFGLPTVSTGIPHIGAYPCVHHCETYAQVQNTIYDVHGHLDQTSSLELKQFLESSTWEQQFKKIEVQLNKIN
ncbi:MAG: hypothetical protein ACE3JP_13810 [Ectobacillus sp.]